MSGGVQRIWPTVQALGRTLVCNRSELLQQGVKAYSQQSNSTGSQNVNVGFNNGYLHNFFPKDRGIVNQSIAKTNRGTYMKVVSRTFSYGTYLYCREFADEENEYAHNILKSLPAYSSTTVRLDSSDIQIGLSNLTPYQILNERDWMISSSEEITQAFIKLSKLSSFYSLSLDDKMFDYICISLAQRIDTFSDNQIMDILNFMSKWTSSCSSSGESYNNLCTALDETCVKRVKRWPADQLFLIADLWYSLGLGRNLMCFPKIISYLSVNIHSFAPHQVVQFMFYANINRDLGYRCMSKLENIILQSVDSLSIEELGIVAMALFKTETAVLTNDLIDKIVDKTVENVKTISNHSLGSILKLLRNSFKATSVTQCYQLLNDLYPHIGRFNNLALLQVALLGNNLLVCHSEVLDIIGGKFAKDLGSLRLKDIERFSYVLMLYKFVPFSCPHIFNLIIEELRDPRRIVEINHFPKCFISCVNYLVNAGHFPHDLISAVFQPSMLQLLQEDGFKALGRELSELDWSLKIEAPSYYKGYRFDPQLGASMTKQYCGRIPQKGNKNLTHLERFIVDVDEKLSSLLGGSDCHLITCVLPHFSTPDIVFCTTADGSPASIPTEYSTLSHCSLKQPCGMQYGLKWNAMIIGGRNSFIRNSVELRGNLEMKKRQLQKLGYHVSVMPHSGFVKRSQKYKFLSLERYLRNSTLNTEGRICSLFEQLNFEMPKQKEPLEGRQAVSS